MQTFKQFLESSDPLLTTQIEMFFRHELNLPRLEAKEATLWMEDEKDWMDLEGDTRDLVIDYIAEWVNADIEMMVSGFIPQYAYDEMRRIMRDKYQIEISTPFMKKHGL